MLGGDLVLMDEARRSPRCRVSAQHHARWRTASAGLWVVLVPIQKA
jgi:hypothetical protein